MRVPLPRREVARASPDARQPVHVSAAADQQLRGLEMAPRGGGVQGRQPSAGRGGRVRPGLKKGANGVRSAEGRGREEWGPVLVVGGVDRGAGVEEKEHERDAVGHGGPVEGRAAPGVSHAWVDGVAGGPREKQVPKLEDVLGGRYMERVGISLLLLLLVLQEQVVPVYGVVVAGTAAAAVVVVVVPAIEESGQLEVPREGRAPRAGGDSGGGRRDRRRCFLPFLESGRFSDTKKKRCNSQSIDLYRVIHICTTIEDGSRKTLGSRCAVAGVQSR